MADLIPLSEAVVPVRARYGELIDAAVHWCHERGEDVDPDLFALLCGGAVHLGDLNDPAAETAPLVWTRIGVRALLRCGIPNFGTIHETDWPLEVVPAVWVWLDFLHDTQRVDPRSDPLWELRKPLICYGGLGFDGRWRPRAVPPPIPCECYLPYRASAEYLNREIDAGRLIGDVLVWDGPSELMEDDGPARVGRRWTSGIEDGAPTGPARRGGARRPGRATRRGAGARRPGAALGGNASGAPRGPRRPRPRGDAGRSGSPPG